MALNGLMCADVPLSNYSLTHPDFWSNLKHHIHSFWGVTSSQT